MPINPLGSSIRVAISAELSTEAALLAYLGVTASEIKKIRWYRARMYNSFNISKGAGKTRLITAPDRRLKYLQRRLLPLINSLYNARNTVHGFVTGRSVRTNALAHLRRRFVVNIDIKDFFPRITENRVVGALTSLGIDRSVASTIGYLCCVNGSIPQGGPTSPALSNIVCFRLDKSLLAFSKEHRYIYTRYADDITLSSHRPMAELFDGPLPPAGRFAPEALKSTFSALFALNGFTINRDKTHYADHHSRRMVTGIKINEILNVDRSYIRKIRSELHSIEILGESGAQIKHSTSGGNGHLNEHLRGKISWIRHIKGHSDPIVRSIVVRFNCCFPDKKFVVSPTEVERRDRAVWIVDHVDGQGTCFFLREIGLVTANHCVDDKNEVEVFHPSKHSNSFKATVLKRDKHRDLAILSHSIPDTEYYELDRANSPINIGDTMTAVGYPAWAPGDHLNVRPGVVSTLTVKSAVQLIEVTQKLTQGMSGGPLLDASGTVAGIIFKGGPNEGRDFAVHIDVLNAWLETARVRTH